MRAIRFTAILACVGALLTPHLVRGFDLGDLEKFKPSKDLQTAINLAQTAAKAGAEFSEEEKYYIGRSVGAHLLAKRPVDDHQSMQRYISHIGQVLALASDKPDTFRGYHFIVLQDEKRVNAYAVPGGFIFITSALVRKAKSEDELAGVLAHEVSHVVLEHPTESIKQSYRDQLKKDLLGIAAEKISEEQKDDLAKKLVAGLNELSGMLIDNAAKGYSRDKEQEADVLAIRVMVRAGYSPSALVSVLRKLDPIGSGESGTHGDPRERARHVAALIEKNKRAGALSVSKLRTARFAEQTRP